MTKADFLYRGNVMKEKGISKLENLGISKFEK